MEPAEGLEFIVAQGFTNLYQRYFISDDHFRFLQQALLDNPLRGPVIRGCGGLRKIRWPDLRRGKGKRGGLRIIYLYVPEANVIGLLDVYDKDEISDLTISERRELAELAERIRAYLLRRSETSTERNE